MSSKTRMKYFPRFVATFVGTILATANVIPLSSSPAFAQVIDGCDSSVTSGFGGGLGSAPSPYLICNRSQLERISTSLNSHYLLKADINLGGASQQWTPIPGSFTGVFDGGYKKISGLSIQSSSITQAGLFAQLGNGAVVKRLGLIEFSINLTTTGNISRAGLIAPAASGNISISEIYVENSTIQGNLRRLGFIVGDSSGSSVSGADLSGSSLSGKLSAELIRIIGSTLSSNHSSNRPIGMGALVGVSRDLEANRISLEPNGAVESKLIHTTTSTPFFSTIGGLVGQIDGVRNSNNYIRETSVDALISATNNVAMSEFHLGGIVGSSSSQAWLELTNVIFRGRFDTNGWSSNRSGLIGFGGNSFDQTPQTLDNVIMAGDFGTLQANSIARNRPGQMYINRFGTDAANNVLSDTPQTGKVTYRTDINHKFKVGELVTITNLIPAGYNVSSTAIEGLTSNTFYLANATTGALDLSQNGYVRGSSTVNNVLVLKYTGFNSGISVSAASGGSAVSLDDLKSIGSFADPSWKIAASDSNSVTSTWQLSDAGDPVWKLEPNSIPSLVWPGYWPPVLNPPTSVVSTNASAGTVNISWIAPAGSPAYYKIEQSSDAGSTWTTAIEATPTSSTTVQVAGLTPGDSYRFRVTAYSSSAFTSEVSQPSVALLTGSNPGSPQNLRAQNLSSSSFRVSWDPPTNTGGLSITSYTLQVDKGNGYETVAHTATSADISGVFVNSSWSFRVLATNVVGSSAYAVYTNIPPVPYAGPSITNLALERVTEKTVTQVLVRGERLSLITSASIDSLPVKILSMSDTQMLIEVPALTLGIKDLRLVSSSGNLTHQDAFEVVVAASSPTGRVNVGSFNGKKVVYAAGLSGKRISWKVGGKWGSAVATSDFVRFVRPTPKRGVNIRVELFVDGVSRLTKVLTTR